MRDAANPRISAVAYPVLVLGPGRRLGVWFDDRQDGVPTTIGDLAEAWRDAIRAGADGLTVAGGEPLDQRAALAALLRAADAVRREETAPGAPAAGRELDILLFTGHDEGDADRSALKPADAVVHGRFEHDRPTALIWRGSANQRLVPRTPLGRRRYEPWLEHVADGPQLQWAPDATGLRLLGVPRPGELDRAERVVRDHGVRVASTSWRTGAGQAAGVDQRTP